MIARALVVFLLIGLSGCIAPKRVFKAPDHTQLVATEQELNSRVVRANVVAARTRLTLEQVKAATERVEAAIASAKPKLAELFRVAPVELHPMILEVQRDVIAAEQDNLNAGQKIVELEKTQEELRQELERANVAKNKHGEEVKAFIGEADKLAQIATEERAARNKAEAQNVILKAKRYGFWVLIGGCLLGAAALWLAKFGAAFRP